jgi:glucokinase
MMREAKNDRRRQFRKLVLAVDIGGTKVEAALVSPRGKIICSERRPMLALGQASEGLRAVREAIDVTLRHPRAKDVRSIGVSVPGWLNTASGTVLKAANLPFWRDYPLAQKLRDFYALPVRIENDASAAALAEAKWGGARGFKNFFYVSLGTGIGTGIVRGDIRGNLQTVPSEGGHMTIDFRGPLCPCGKRGCVEMYASGKALARRAKSLLAKRSMKNSPLIKLAKRSPGGLTAELVGSAASGGDKLATQILEDACDHLTVWLGNIIDLLEPEAIVFGGGLGRLMLSLTPRIHRKLKIHAIHPGREQIRILGAQFGARSALLGAAALWSRE